MPPPPSYPEKATYERLCRETTSYASNIVPELTCFYWYGRQLDSFIAWAPIKTEILYPDPIVVQFYDIISNQEADTVKKLAMRQLKRATIRDPKTGLHIYISFDQSEHLHFQISDCDWPERKHICNAVFRRVYCAPQITECKKRHG